LLHLRSRQKIVTLDEPAVLRFSLILLLGAIAGCKGSDKGAMFVRPTTQPSRKTASPQLEQVEGRERTYINLRPKKKKQLPNVLGVEEVVRLLNAVDKLKHPCILKAIHSGGLRLSELTNLRLADIPSDRMQIFGHDGKCEKDRYTTLSKGLLLDLRTCFLEYKPDYWLFDGHTGGQYPVRTVSAILKNAVKRSGVHPYPTVHTLSHRYATHLSEQGTSLQHIQELLGHASSTTTEIYTHMSTAEKQASSVRRTDIGPWRNPYTGKQCNSKTTQPKRTDYGHR
jgi:integrase